MLHTRYKDSVFPKSVRTFNQRFADCDFTGTDFSLTGFRHSHFSNCHFNKSIFYSDTFTSCFFNHCSFTDIDFSETNLGHRGGGQSNCRFVRCRFGPLHEASYLVDTRFEHCHLKDMDIKSFYWSNAKFIGPLDNVRPIKSRFREAVIGYSKPRIAAMKAHIESMAPDGIHIDFPLVDMHRVDFSEASFNNTNWENCEWHAPILPKQDNCLLISNIASVSTRVLGAIRAEWPNHATYDLALKYAQRFLHMETGIISHHELQQMADSHFANQLTTLFLRYQ